MGQTQGCSGGGQGPIPDSSQQICFIDAGIELLKGQMELAHDLANEPAIALAEAMGHQLSARQAACQHEVTLPIPNIFRSVSRQDRDGGQETHIPKGFGHLAVLLQLAKVHSMLQDQAVAYIAGILILVPGTVIIDIGDIFMAQAPVFQDLGDLLVGNSHSLLLGDVDAPGAFGPAGFQKRGGGGAEFPAEGFIKPGIGVEAIGQGRLCLSGACLHGIDPMQQPPAQDILHHGKTRGLLKKPVIMEQGKACHVRQLRGCDLRFQIIFDIVEALLDDLPDIHTLPSFLSVS